MDDSRTTAPEAETNGWFRRVSPTQWVIDIVVGGVFALFAFATVTALDPGAPPLPGYATALTMVAALMLSRVSPPLALIVAWVGALGQMGAGLPPILGNTAIFVVLFATAAYGTKVVFWAGFASAFVGAVAIAVYLVMLPGIFAVPGWAGWELAVPVIATFTSALFALMLSWTLGALTRAMVRTREGRRAQREAEERAAAEEERGRIARDMHDVVAHSLAVVIAQADGARYAAAADPETAKAALTTISQTARAALADVRVLLTQLRHRQAEGPQPTLADLEQLYAQVRAAGVELRVDVDPVPPGEPPAAVQLAVYRILQEALTNALRHGDGGPVDVGLSWLPDRVGLEVRNGLDGEPRTESSLLAGGVEPGGHGLIGMRERAQLAGGRLDAGPEGGAFVVRAELPIGRAA
ncbi:sensor histidine kinase [Microbacterium album]|uniref:histidine kinase n=1 Tax=Microbacterium album TaxID=2053191 RepID=A0A917MLC7_9MICO|nr:histidine kinase [Microbacterium album]GGH41663.1 two-component sensor histidine kinase [Microbacterium album]